MRECFSCGKSISLFAYSDYCNSCLVEEISFLSTCTVCFHSLINNRCPKCEQFIYIKYGKSATEFIEIYEAKPINPELYKQIHDYKPNFIQINRIKNFKKNFLNEELFLETMVKTISNCE